MDMYLLFLDMFERLLLFNKYMSGIVSNEKNKNKTKQQQQQTKTISTNAFNTSVAFQMNIVCFFFYWS